jgi:hypothetical protein
MFQAEEQQVSDATLQNSVARETWGMELVHLWTSEQWFGNDTALRKTSHFAHKLYGYVRCNSHTELEFYPLLYLGVKLGLSR